MNRDNAFGNNASLRINSLKQAISHRYWCLQLWVVASVVPLELKSGKPFDAPVTEEKLPVPDYLMGETDTVL